MSDGIPDEPETGLSAEDFAGIGTFHRAFSGRPELLDEALTPDWQDIPLARGQAPGRGE